MPRILIMNAGTPQMSGAHLTKAQLSLAAKRGLLRRAT